MNELETESAGWMVNINEKSFACTHYYFANRQEQSSKTSFRRSIATNKIK